jgi:hypothetical protein
MTGGDLRERDSSNERGTRTTAVFSHHGGSAGATTSTSPGCYGVDAHAEYPPALGVIPERRPGCEADNAGLSVAELLDDEVRVSAFDDGLDLEVFVSWCDDVLEGVLAHLLEDGRIELDRHRAAGVAALADERYEPLQGEVVCALLQFDDAEVDLTKEFFVADGALFAGRHSV